MKSTELLYNEIMNAENLDSYLKNNNEDVTQVSLEAYLQSMLKKVDKLNKLLDIK